MSTTHGLGAVIAMLFNHLSNTIRFYTALPGCNSTDKPNNQIMIEGSIKTNVGRKTINACESCVYVKTSFFLLCCSSFPQAHGKVTRSKLCVDKQHFCVYVWFYIWDYSHNNLKCLSAHCTTKRSKAPKRVWGSWLRGFRQMNWMTAKYVSSPRVQP